MLQPRCVPPSVVRFRSAARVAGMLAGLAGACTGVLGDTALPADVQRIELREALAIGGVAQTSRRPFNIDAVALAVVRGRLGDPALAPTPRAGDELALPESITASGAPQQDQAARWVSVQADEQGGFASPQRGGYLLFVIDNQSTQDRVMVLEASGHAMAYVNGEPRMGDMYSHGYVHVPVLLRPGENQILVPHAGRGPFRGLLRAPRGEVEMIGADATLPDVLVGEQEQPAFRAGAVAVMNTTTKARTIGLLASPADSADALDSIQSRIAKDNRHVAPLGVTKVPVRILGVISEAQKPTIALKVGADDLEPLGELELRRIAAGATHKRTFLSEIDHSVQYYAVVPPREPEAGYGATGLQDKPGLVLTLHGASVEAISQAQAYSAKEGLVIVAPTNRRPFGFDWEDWGRIDAMEVLLHARKAFGTDPRRQFITGHSMGGHGTWQLGVLYPEQFAVVAPSAGWLSFDTYMQALGRGSTSPGSGPIADVFAGARASSDTPALMHSLRGRGVSILHGDADDNVPVSEARKAREILDQLEIPYEHHEQAGAGHWWDDDESTPGAACVDWPLFFAMFEKHALPEPAPRAIAPHQSGVIDERGFSRGSFKRVFDRGFVLVYGTQGTPQENAQALAKARYDAEQWWYRSNGTTSVITDVQALEQPPHGNVVLYGNADMNAAWTLASPWVDGDPAATVQVHRARVALAGRELHGDDLGVMVVMPRAEDAAKPQEERRLVGAIAGTGLEGSRALDRLPVFLAGVGFPDVMVARAAIWESGAAGVEAAGMLSVGASSPLHTGIRWRDGAK